MKASQAGESLYLKEKFKEDKQKEMAYSPVNMPQVSGHVYFFSRNLSSNIANL
jgi:hypothetical protein